jgi:hypothetical protein
MKKELVPFRRGLGGEKSFQRELSSGEDISPAGHNSLRSPENQEFSRTREAFGRQPVDIHSRGESWSVKPGFATAGILLCTDQCSYLPAKNA